MQGHSGAEPSPGGGPLITIASVRCLIASSPRQGRTAAQASPLEEQSEPAGWLHYQGGAQQIRIICISQQTPLMGPPLRQQSLQSTKKLLARRKT